MMKTVKLHAVGELRIHDEPIPVPVCGESLIKITAVGICGSDLHWYTESGIGDAHLDRPLILGHEFAGRIVSGDKSGSLVAVDPAIPCEKCEWCVKGHPNLCPNVHFAGHGETDGALRQYLTWSDRLLYELPDNLTDIEGAMLEPLGVALHSVDLAHLRPGMTVGVFGCGPIGLMIIQLVKICGATKIIATDRLPHRVNAAIQYGADEAALADGETENRWVLEQTNSRGVDVAFEVAGENEAIETAVVASKPGGKVLLVGIPGEDNTSFTASIARRKGLTIKFVRRMKHVYPRAIDLVAKKKVDVASLVSHSFHLEECQEAFLSAQKREGLKVMISEF
jgi:L-iditol 2-dehydrogenase